MNTLADNNYHDHSKDKPNKWIVIVVLLLSLTGIIYSLSKSVGKDVISGKVLKVLSERETTKRIGDKNEVLEEQDLLVEIMTGSERREISVLNDYEPVAKGDKIFLSQSLFGNSEWSMVNISRTRDLIILFVFFIVLVILTSGWKGFYSLVGLLFTFAVIFIFMLPQILQGVSPVLIGVSGASIILIPTLYLSYGFNKKSLAAFLGIIIALIFVGFISNYFVNSLKFTGANEAFLYLNMASTNSINIVGLLIAGIIIAAVGVLDDVAAIQSSVVFSLAGANPDLRGLRLFREAMRVGKDHISAVVNTLVLAYTGASLPVILLLSIQKMPLDYLVSLEIVAEEIARTLISSSGLLLAVPLTTIIATIMVSRNKKNKCLHSISNCEA